MFSFFLTDNPCLLKFDEKKQGTHKPGTTSRESNPADDCPLVKKMVAVNERGWRIGETHHRAKATDAEIDLIRELHEEHGWGYRKLSMKFKLSKRTIRDICSYRKRAQFISGWRTRYQRENGDEKK